MRVIVSFSGGKDSQACLIQACHEFGANNVEALFIDTGWEHHLTYEHVHEVADSLGVRLVTLRNESVGGFEQLCKRMKWFPDSARRMCTVQLKVRPSIDYITSLDDDIILIQGIRGAESSARSKLPCSADYFAEYYSEEGKRLYKKTKVLEWCKHHKCTVERPMFGMSGQQIIDYILENGQQPNPLYRLGCSRVGCFPCIYARMADLKILSKDEKYVNRVANLEKEVNLIRGANATPAAFFPKGKIPERFCKEFGRGIASISDIMNYVRRDDAQLDLFESEAESSCMSIYHGLCE